MSEPNKPTTVPSVDDIVLLPCPFCGGAPDISESDDGMPRWVWCPGCEADGPPIDYRFKGSKAKARRIVVDAWNRRDGDPCREGCKIKRAVKEMSDSLTAEY
jgi:hypothetical protein